MEELYGDVVAIWRDWATDVRGVAIHSGHHVAEEAPDEQMAEEPVAEEVTSPEPDQAVGEERELLAFFGESTGDS